jgi:hypothetical protein
MNIIPVTPQPYACFFSQLRELIIYEVKSKAIPVTGRGGL